MTENAGPGPAPVCVNCGRAAYLPDGAPAWVHVVSGEIECAGGATDCEPVIFLDGSDRS